MQKKVKSCAILHRSMKLCMVVDSDSKINFRSKATAAKFIYFGLSGYSKI